MLFFKRTPPVETPPAVKRYRKQTHAAAKDASKELKKLNKVMGNGVTLKIFLAAGGRNHVS